MLQVRQVHYIVIQCCCTIQLYECCSAKVSIAKVPYNIIIVRACLYTRVMMIILLPDSLTLSHTIIMITRRKRRDYTTREWLWLLLFLYFFTYTIDNVMHREWMCKLSSRKEYQGNTKRALIILPSFYWTLNTVAVEDGGKWKKNCISSLETLVFCASTSYS